MAFVILSTINGLLSLTCLIGLALNHRRMRAMEDRDRAHTESVRAVVRSLEQSKRENA